MIRSAQTGMMLWLLASLVVANSGCGGSSKIPLVSVSGTVTFDGKSLEDGQLSFVTTTTTPPRAYGCAVKNGSYSVKTEAGAMKIQVIAMREVPGKYVIAADGARQPEMENYIPKKFNSATELTYDVPTSGARNVSFELKP